MRAEYNSLQVQVCITALELLWIRTRCHFRESEKSLPLSEISFATNKKVASSIRSFTAGGKGGA